MIFTKKNMGLDFLSNGSLGKVPMGAVDAMTFYRSPMKDAFSAVFNQYKSEFRGNIKYISKPFMRAYDKAREAISSTIDSTLFEIKDDAGTLIVGDDLIMYAVGNNGDELGLFVAIINEGALSYVGSVVFNKDSDKEKAGHWVSSAYNNEVPVVNFLAIPLGYLIFLQFADTETHTIEPRKKMRILGDRFKNETDLKIRVVGCEWYTTLVRSEGFDVRGHFRLQPCGQNLQERKLIWINPFRKNGYTRRAQIIINEENASYRH